MAVITLHQRPSYEQRTRSNESCTSNKIFSRLYTAKISVYPRIFCGEFPYFNETGSTYVCICTSKRMSKLQCGPALCYSVDIRIQTYAEPVPLKYGKLATKYTWIYGYFCRVRKEKTTILQLTHQKRRRYHQEPDLWL